MSQTQARKVKLRTLIRLAVLLGALVALGVWVHYVMQTRAEAAEYERITRQEFDQGNFAAAARAYEELFDRATLRVARVTAESLARCYPRVLTYADEAEGWMQRIQQRHDSFSPRRRHAHEPALLAAYMAMADRPALSTAERAAFARKARAIDPDALQDRHHREIELDERRRQGT